MWTTSWFGARSQEKRRLFDPHCSEGCCEEFQIKKGTTKLTSVERLVPEFEKKGPSERLSTEAVMGGRLES